MRPGQKIGPRQKNTLTFAAKSVIISRHSTECRVYRGIAQLVEQRSPKPRAVSSRLTTPAKSTVPAGAVLFCYPHAPRCPVIGWPQKEDAYGYRIPAAVAAAAGGGRRCADPADGACQRAGR